MCYLKNMSLSHGIDIIKSYARNMPVSPGVYQMHNKNGDVLYIGKAKALKNRVTSYTQPNRAPIRIQRMIAQTDHMRFTITETEAEALLLEQTLIKSKKPPFNVLLRDDKSFPYIVLDTSHEFPSIRKHRGKRDKSKTYFGPFASAKAVNQVLTDIQRGFQIRNCTNSYYDARKRPCLQYHIKRCSAPCVNKVTRGEYAQQVKDVNAFMRGDNDSLKTTIQKQMQEASEAMAYERAAQLRDRLQALSYVQNQRLNISIDEKNMDIFVLSRRESISAMCVFFIRNGRDYGHASFYPKHDSEQSDAQLMQEFMVQFYTNRPLVPNIMVSHAPDEQEIVEEALSKLADHKVSINQPQRGRKKKYLEQCVKTTDAQLAMQMAQTKVNDELLSKLAGIYGGHKPPERIEIYDNSHIQGAFKVGAYVVYDEGGFNKKEYRQYNITETDTGDDFAMMREVMRRRIAKIKDGGVSPDLMIIDGGKGQLSQVLNMMEQDWIDTEDKPAIIAVAKGVDRNAGREVIHTVEGDEIRLEKNDPVLHFIQRLRDESHRFVIGRHRLKREKSISQNDLGGLPQIGPMRKKALLQSFGSAKAVRSAGVKALQQVEGISKALAEQIYKYYHE